MAANLDRAAGFERLLFDTLTVDERAVRAVAVGNHRVAAVQAYDGVLGGTGAVVEHEIVVVAAADPDLAEALEIERIDARAALVENLERVDEAAGARFRATTVRLPEITFRIARLGLARIAPQLRDGRTEVLLRRARPTQQVARQAGRQNDANLAAHDEKRRVAVIVGANDDFARTKTPQAHVVADNSLERQRCRKHRLVHARERLDGEHARHLDVRHRFVERRVPALRRRYGNRTRCHCRPAVTATDSASGDGLSRIRVYRPFPCTRTPSATRHRPRRVRCRHTSLRAFLFAPQPDRRRPAAALRYSTTLSPSRRFSAVP